MFCSLNCFVIKWSKLILRILIFFGSPNQKKKRKKKICKWRECKMWKVKKEIKKSSKNTFKLPLNKIVEFSMIRADFNFCNLLHYINKTCFHMGWSLSKKISLFMLNLLRAILIVSWNSVFVFQTFLLRQMITFSYSVDTK
jgi:hypothetical protein